MCSCHHLSEHLPPRATHRLLSFPKPGLSQMAGIRLQETSQKKRDPDLASAVWRGPLEKGQGGCPSTTRGKGRFPPADANSADRCCPFGGRCADAPSDFHCSRALSGLGAFLHEPIPEQTLEGKCHKWKAFNSEFIFLIKGGPSPKPQM